jgi:hypothetical protein
MGSGFDDLIYWHAFIITVDLTAHTFNSFLTTSVLRISRYLGLIARYYFALSLLELTPHRRHQVEQLIILCCPVGCHKNLVY